MPILVGRERHAAASARRSHSKANGRNLNPFGYLDFNSSGTETTFSNANTMRSMREVPLGAS